MFTDVVVGGTFEVLHAGHKKLFEAAFGVGERVVVGLTSDEFAVKFKTVDMPSYAERESVVREHLDGLGGGYEILPINDYDGFATVKRDVDAIVVSEETLLRAEEINAIRYKKGLAKLAIIVVPLVAAADGKPLSSERVARGEVDAAGKIL